LQNANSIGLNSGVYPQLYIIPYSFLKIFCNDLYLFMYVWMLYPLILMEDYLILSQLENIKIQIHPQPLQLLLKFKYQSFIKYP
jgi:hypothetical protein